VLACDGFSGSVKVYRVYRWSSWISEGKGGPGLSLAVVRDLREARVPAGPDELLAFETDVLAGFVLARAAAGLSDATIRSDVLHLEQLRAWFGGPLWDMQPADADAYFGTVLRVAAKGTRLARCQALKTYFLFLELRHKVAIHQMTGRVAECPVDEMNRPRGAGRAALRIPPSAVQVGVLFAGWRAELATCRKFAPAARSYAAARLMADVGLRVNEVSHLDLADVKWDLGRFGKLHVRIGKGARGSGPRERMVPLINGAGATLRWFVQDVWSFFDDDHARPGAPLFCSERRNADGTAARAGNETLRSDLAAAAAAHLPDWPDRVTPHVLRHFCASQLYLGGMDLVAIQETLGHAWVATTMNYIHVHATHVEDAWIAGQQRAAGRLKGLGP
jgi:integrase/recombinase XerD